VYHDAVQCGHLTPSTFTYTTLISLYGARARTPVVAKSFAPSRFSEDVDSAMRLFDEMLKKGIKPTVVTYGALVATCAKLEHCEQAFKVLCYTHMLQISNTTLTPLRHAIRCRR
jgi:hypothetical protein